MRKNSVSNILIDCIIFNTIYLLSVFDVMFVGPIKKRGPRQSSPINPPLCRSSANPCYNTTHILLTVSLGAAVQLPSTTLNPKRNRAIPIHPFSLRALRSVCPIHRPRPPNTKSISSTQPIRKQPSTTRETHIFQRRAQHSVNNLSLVCV